MNSASLGLSSPKGRLIYRFRPTYFAKSRLFWALFLEMLMSPKNNNCDRIKKAMRPGTGSRWAKETTDCRRSGASGNLTDAQLTQYIRRMCGRWSTSMSIVLAARERHATCRISKRRPRPNPIRRAGRPRSLADSKNWRPKPLLGLRHSRQVGSRH